MSSITRPFAAAAILCLAAVPLSAQIGLGHAACQPPPRLAATPGADLAGAPGGSEALGGDVVLWDQTAFGTTAWVDQVFTDFPDSSAYQVSDIDTAGATWRVNKVTTYFTQGVAGSWTPGSITTGNLQVYEKTGTLPDDVLDLAPEYTVPITLVDVGGTTWAVEADTTGIAELQCISGEFWVGLTPITTFGPDGQEYHWVSTAVGEESGFRNPGGAHGLGTGWLGLSAADTISGGPPYDGAITLEGEVLAETWVDLGGGLLSASWGDVPVASGSGVACAFNDITISGFHCGAPFAGTNLVIGFTAINFPFKGGTMVPAPDQIVPLPTGADGDIDIPLVWPGIIPAGFKFILQFWQNEPPWSASNGLEITGQ